MTKFDEFDQYSEELLLAQYDVSEIISHEVTKGTVREDFLISTLEACSDPKPILVRGTVSDGTNDAGQMDIILCRPFAHMRRLGTQCLVEKSDALCVIEVKGNCRGRDLKGADIQASKVSLLDGNSAPMYGVVAYKVALEERTILKRFGLSYDSSARNYYDNALDPNESKPNWAPIKYTNLDFFVSLEEGKKIFLRKYEPTPGVFRFVRLVEQPIIKVVFLTMNSIWREANQQPTVTVS